VDRGSLGAARWRPVRHEQENVRKFHDVRRARTGPDESAADERPELLVRVEIRDVEMKAHEIADCRLGIADWIADSIGDVARRLKPTRREWLNRSAIQSAI